MYSEPKLKKIYVIRQCENKIFLLISNGIKMSQDHQAYLTGQKIYLVLNKLILKVK